MCSRPIVVVHLLRQNLAKMPFADHDDVVKAFPSNRTNHSLGIRALPRRARRNDLSFAKTMAGRAQAVDLSVLIQTQSRLDDHSPAPPASCAAWVGPSFLTVTRSTASSFGTERRAWGSTK